MLWLGNFFGTFFSYTFKAFGEDSSIHPGLSDVMLTWAASIGSGVVNGFTRLSLGLLQDRKSFRALYGLLLIVQLLNSLVVYWASWIPWMFFICILLNYFSLGGLFAIFPTSVARVFGINMGPQVYVAILFGSFLSGVTNMFVTHYILPATSFVFIFYLGSVITVIVMIILFNFKEELDVDNLAKKGALRYKESYFSQLDD